MKIYTEKILLRTFKERGNFSGTMIVSYCSCVFDKMVVPLIFGVILNRGAGYKTWHKIAVRSYKQPFRGKNRGFVTNHFWDWNLKWGLRKRGIWLKTFWRGSYFKRHILRGEKKRGLINSQIWKKTLINDKK